MSHMRTTMQTQPDELRRLLADRRARRRRRRSGSPAGARGWSASGRAGTPPITARGCCGAAGLDACALHAADVAPYARRFDAADAVIVLSHTGQTGYTAQAREAAREAGAAVVHVTAIGKGGDLETVAPGDLVRLHREPHRRAHAPGPDRRGARRAISATSPRCPTRWRGVLAAPGPVVEPPDRLLELIGAGPNAWTAAEGALKVREASYVATEGLSSEQFLHGPSVALDAQDTLVALDGGGPAAARTEAIAAAMEVTGARVVRIAERDLGEALSIFPLTVWVQRIAVELAEARGVSPDRFRYEEDPAREQAIESLGF